LTAQRLRRSSNGPLALQFIDLLLFLLQFLLLLLDNVHHERAAKKNGWLIDIVMFVTETSLANVIAAHTWPERNSPQRPDTTGFKQEGRPLLQRMADPSLRKGAQDVAVSNDQYVAGRVGGFLLRTGEGRRLPFFADILDQPVDALRHLFWGSVGR
jgi:hypothetical protein